MDTPDLKLLARAMQTYNMRMQALSSNIANLDTPGYKRMSVNFEEALQRARHQSEGSADLSGVQPQVETEDRAPVLEDELMELADTQMRVQLVTRALREHFAGLTTGITGRTG